MVVWIFHKNLVRGDARSLRPGSAEFRGSTLGFVVAWCKLAVRAQLRTSLVGNFLDGDCWKCGLLFGDTQEHLWNRILRRSDDDDDGASCVITSTRTTDSSSPSCFTNPDVRSSTGNRQPRCSSSSEKHSESHRREWPRSSEGILSLARRRTSNIVRSRRRHSSLE